jgi:hypothetical protein
MPFQSYDHLIQRLSSNNFWRWDYCVGSPTTAFTNARHWDMSRLRRDGPFNSFAGTAKTWQTCDDATGNGTDIFGIPHRGNVSPATKHILNISAAGTSTTALGFLSLVDIQGYWPGIQLNNTSAQTLSGTPTLRYANGIGCGLYLTTTTAPSGSQTPNVSISYTNVPGTSGRSLGRTVSLAASSLISQITTSGIAANNYGPYLPLAAGDTGVQNVASITISAAQSGSGVAALVLAKTLATIPITTIYNQVDKDLIGVVPSLPLVKDGACLSWIFFSNAATALASQFHGHIDFSWA